MRRGIVSWLVALMVEMGAWGVSALTREQLQQAEGPVREATTELLAALSRGEIMPAVAAEEVRILASQTESSAEAYLLLQGAFRLYVRAGEYRRVVEVSRHLSTRDYSARRLVGLIEGALKPVPRGVDVGELESHLRALKEEAARSRKRNMERRLTRALESWVVERFSTEEAKTLPAVLERMRKDSGSPLRMLVRCPLPVTGGEDFPLLPAMKFAGTTAAAVVARCAAEGEFTLRSHGTLQLFTRTAPVAQGGQLPKNFFAGDTARTLRQLKRIPIGFVAFDGNEPLDEALERMFLAVEDYGGTAGSGFDVLLRSEPNGKFPLLKTVRASDTTLYDALDLACRAAGATFEVCGNCIVVLPN